MSNDSRRGAPVVWCATTLWLASGVAVQAQSANAPSAQPSAAAPADTTSAKSSPTEPTGNKPTDAKLAGANPADAKRAEPQSSDAKPTAAKTTWTTYLYQGPGYRFSVIDEVPQLTAVDLGTCAKDWCKVRYDDRIGYVRANVVARGSLANPGDGVLAQPAAAVSPLPPAGPCFEANQTGGNGGDAMTRFCEKTK